MALGLVAVTLKFAFGYSRAFGFIPMFYLDYEFNFPTWFSSFHLAAIGMTLLLIAWTKKALQDIWSRHWGVLGLIFFYLSIDEFARLHERVVGPLREYFNLSGIFYFAWVLPALILLIGFAAAYAKFTLALPARTRNWFVLSALIYVGGAMGVEMIGSAYASAYDSADLQYALLTCVEETIEMTGLAVFLLTLLDYMHRQWGKLTLSFER